MMEEAVVGKVENRETGVLDSNCATGEPFTEQSVLPWNYIESGSSYIPMIESELNMASEWHVSKDFVLGQECNLYDTPLFMDTDWRGMDREGQTHGMGPNVGQNEIHDV